eukprot:35252-Chlamydomonas_euryale.AAC.10
MTDALLCRRGNVPPPGSPLPQLGSAAPAPPGSAKLGPMPPPRHAMPTPTYAGMGLPPPGKRAQVIGAGGRPLLGIDGEPLVDASSDGAQVWSCASADEGMVWHWSGG